MRHQTIKIWKVIIAGLLVAIGGLAFRTLWYAGTFKSLKSHSPGEMKVIPGMMGAEDITIDFQTGKALVSSYDRRKVIRGEVSKGAIYLLDFQAVPPVFTDLTANFEQPDFHPHGISLFTDPADLTKWLFVVNHRDKSHFIEIFQLTDSALVHKESVSSERLISPNDVAGVGKRQFYFTNDHDSKGGVSHFKDFLMIGTGQVGYFDGEKTTILDTGIRYANGITVSKDGSYLFVAACTDRSVLVYEREPFRRVNRIGVGTGLDNLEWDAEGNLWTAAHPKMLAFLGHAKDPAKRSPSQILKISFSCPAAGASVEEIFLSDGNPFSGSSVAAVYRDYLLMGTVFEDGVLIGRLSNN